MNGTSYRVEVFAALIVILSGCGKKTLSPSLSGKAEIDGSFLVKEVVPSAASSGQTLTIRGSGFSDDVSFTIDGQPLDVISRSGTSEVAVRMPAGVPGARPLVVSKNAESSSVTVLRLVDGGILADNASLICAGQAFYDSSGQAIAGTKDCTPTPGAQSIKTELLAVGAVTTDRLAPESVTGTALAPSAVESKHLAPKAVGEAALADGAVTTPKLADKAVSAQKLAAAAVGTVQLADAAVTGAKLDDRAVTLAKLSGIDDCNDSQIMKWNANLNGPGRGGWACDDDRGLSGAVSVTSSDITNDTIRDEDIGSGAAISLSKLGTGTANIDVSGSAAAFTGNLGGEVQGPQSNTTIAANAVTNVKIAAGAVTDSKISGSVTLKGTGSAVSELFFRDKTNFNVLGFKAPLTLSGSTVWTCRRLIRLVVPCSAPTAATSSAGSPRCPLRALQPVPI